MIPMFAAAAFSFFLFSRNGKLGCFYSFSILEEKGGAV